MNAFCASENCDAFIVFRSFPSEENAPENSNQNWSSLKGSDQHLGRPTLWKPITAHVLPPDENVHRESSWPGPAWTDRSFHCARWP
ncbi:hypothetical protein E0H35_36905 [Rhizobium leguminosarum bv. viciae]|nr:hypothetical protein [Rhizobium leguminosarum bv. viciae]NKK54231.1 hypothetical protein [Rhizobium leguminosarum bv. viciae]NKL39395.1 hypothetical protein [Rhizobium leguminosarum bv. viciae]TBY16708.1 hypothetical protein E0H37_36405 [Rhizobium leguminosarum bv. viciae]TBY18033.1 hypothetical protein E0H55_37520 [Rhizobium leguminosarum bv. viciae]